MFFKHISKVYVNLMQWQLLITNKLGTRAMQLLLPVSVKI